MERTRTDSFIAATLPLGAASLSAGLAFCVLGYSDITNLVPRTANRHRNGGLEDVPLHEIVPGDRLPVREGDVVPADGTVATGSASAGTPALTGKCLHVRPARGAEAFSGSIDAGEAFGLSATRRAKECTRDGIVRLVEEAQRSELPLSRLADRRWPDFLAVTVAVALAAGWFTGDPNRTVAMVVVAASCPLILAVLVTLVGGISRAPHLGVLIEDAARLETVARIRAPMLDETGPQSDGRPNFVSIDGAGDGAGDHILCLAAALGDAPKRPVAQAVAAAGLDGVQRTRTSAAAGLGVAMGARGAAASAGAADVVVLVDRIDKLSPLIGIDRASWRNAIEGAFAGICLSLLGLIAATCGYLTPVQGTLLQVVSLNALGALQIAPHEQPRSIPRAGSTGQASIPEGATA